MIKSGARIEGVWVEEARDSKKIVLYFKEATVKYKISLQGGYNHLRGLQNLSLHLKNYN